MLLRGVSSVSEGVGREHTCDNNFHGAGMANGDEGIEKEMEGRMG
jgi:hypothetical protein